MRLKVVSISGGKDSTACALLALERHRADEVRLVFADTGNEHEQTLEYVHDYLPSVLGIPVHTVRADFAAQMTRKAAFVATKWREQGISEDRVMRATEVLKPTGNPFLDLCIWKGRFPSRMAQFCTQELKTLPLTEWQTDLIDDGYEVESWQGIRADESPRRAMQPEREDRGGGLTIYRPILQWTAQQTVDYVRSKGLVLNPLYSQGMRRVGCMPCINARKDEVLEIAKRFPEHIDRIEAWEVAVSEASKLGVSSFFHASDGSVLSGQSNIRSVVEWAKTSRGGRQYEIMRADDFESPACASAYGLCE